MKRWLSTPEMCERYGVCRVTIHRWERAGHIPRAIRRPGQRPRWFLPAVEDADQRAQRVAERG